MKANERVRMAWQKFGSFERMVDFICGLFSKISPVQYLILN